MTDGEQRSGRHSATNAVRIMPHIVSLVTCSIILIVFFSKRDLWLDEAMIALNIKYLSARELLGPLEYDQVAPAGWLLLQKFAHGLTNRIEYDMRLLSVVSGLATVFILPRLSVAVIGRVSALVVAILAATSSPLIRYATEAKPYMTDVLLALVVMGIGVHLLSQRRIRPLPIAVLCLAGSIGIAVSFPVAFILFGIGTVLTIHALISKDIRGAFLLSVAGLAWLTLFGLLTLSISTQQATGTTVTAGSSHGWFIDTAFLPLPPTSTADLVWIARWCSRTLQFFFAEGKFAAALLIVGGIVVLARRRPWQSAMLLVPIVAAVFASSLRLYPLFDRTLLFMLPALCVFIGAAVAALAAGGRLARILSVTGLALAVVPGSLQIATALGRTAPFSSLQITPLIAVLERERAAGDLIYVGQRATPSYLLYSRQGKLAGVPWIAGMTRTADWACWGGELPLTQKPVRVWVIHPRMTPPTDDVFRTALPFQLSTPVLRANTDNSLLYSFVARAMPSTSNDGAARRALRRACATASDDLGFPVPRRFQTAVLEGHADQGAPAASRPQR